MERFLLTLLLMGAFAFAENVRIVYSSYILALYDASTQKNGNGLERTIQEAGFINIKVDGDSSMEVSLMNQVYELKYNSFYETVNEDKDSVAVFTANGKEDEFSYILVLGSDYTNFVKKNFWKISFETPQDLNQRDDDGSYNVGLVSGSSFAITKHELITNNHVIEGLKKIRINNKPVSKKGYINAYVLYRDPDLDLAVLHTDSNLTSCAIDRNIYDIGEEVFVYGYPQFEKQGTSLKLTKGVISSKRGFKDDVKTYQIDAAVQPGNSGGPLVRKGKVIGVTSSRLVDSQNVNYAIKSNFVGSIIDVLGIKNTGKGDPKNCTYFVIGESN